MMRMPSVSSIFQAYASLSATITLFQTILNQVIPLQIQNYIVSKILSYFRPHSSNITLAIEEKEGVVTNEVYATAEIYLSAKTSPQFQRFNVSKRPKDPKVNVKFANCGKTFEGIELVWRFVHDTEKKTMTKDEYDTGIFPNEKHYFELSFNKQYKNKIMNCYIPFVLNKAKDMSHEKKVVKLHSLANILTYNFKPWDSVNLEHPSTFDTLALEPALKKSIIEDLDRFLKRKDLLKFGKFFVPHCIDLPDRTKNRAVYGHSRSRDQDRMPLGGLLNFINGLWSSIGDERVIIFTTNHKEKLDPALLRPGRMDKHIHMSYLTIESFKVLATNYLEIYDLNNYDCFQEIQELIESVQVTTAEVGEELTKSEDADVCLSGLVNFLKSKRINNTEEETTDDATTKE
uniref:Uncharacterized protein LOC104248575 n=1 Tax=Nicotiana sylvestris TaxID=4096 RepID=A0A1U7YVE0_NICSY|nr:PREDICTED: uncharacterized protein LOC104248575 [Nicotiana sylvestris]